MLVRDLKELLNSLPDDMEIIIEARDWGEFEEDDTIDTFNVDEIEVYEKLLVFIHNDGYCP